MLEKFQGPLELLLNLIEQEKLAITEVAVAQVTEQYFHYLAKLEENREDELADFLVIATKLVYLKSRYLLPYLYPVADDDGPGLAEQLKLYKRYAEASKVVKQLWAADRVAYGRTPPPLPPSGNFIAPPNAYSRDLRSSIVLLLQRLTPVNPLPQGGIDRSISVKQRIESICQALKTLKRLTFSELLSTTENRTEVIVSFLALLELVKQEKIAIHQDEAFEEMIIKRV